MLLRFPHALDLRCRCLHLLSQGHRSARPVEFGVWTVRARRRIWQPRHQSHGAVSQPGHARARQLFAAHVSPLVGPDDDPAEHLSSQHAVGLPHAGALRAGTSLDRIRCRRHLRHHPQLRKGARDVQAGAPAVAEIDHHHRRACRGNSAAGQIDRCRHCGTRRRHLLDAPLSGRRSQRAHRSSGNFFRIRHARAGHRCA
jgi:hypothetical protein